MTDAYRVAIDAMRLFHNRFAAARPDDEVLITLSSDLNAWAERLASVEVDEARQLWGKQFDLPVQGKAMIPPATILSIDAHSVHATVTFGRYFGGQNNAAHGGAIALLFDDLLGRLATPQGLKISGVPWNRTAYLTTNYRSVTPLNEELEICGHVTNQEGRKKFVRGELWNGTVLCADAEALFVNLKPGQS